MSTTGKEEAKLMGHDLGLAAGPRGISIRPMRTADRLAVIKLDAAVFGQARTAYFERRLAALEHESNSDHQLIFLAAVSNDDEIIGFIMGTLTSGEFGLPHITGVIDSIAVHPRYRRQHIGRLLIETFLNRSAALGARAAYTLVQWDNWELLKVFHALGFSLPSTIPLERRIG
jgi:ribosomal protein S18 acetylase RimI-like enzyme